MKTPFSPFVTLALAASTAFLHAQQQGGKTPVPAPAVDLDRKLEIAARPAASTAGKVATGLAAEPEASGRAAAILSDGRQVAPVLPADRLLFDTENDGSVLACAETYKARVAAGGFTYVPFFGSDAPRNYPLTLVLERAELGSVVPPMALAQPHRDGNTVTIERGALQERYAFAPTSVEQEFVVAQPFAGDLALTLRVDSELTGGRDGDDLRFTGERGHVSYTAAVLVDACGRRVPMSTEYAAGRITLRAPASVLAQLAFPVTVDPILTTTTVLNHPSVVLRRPDTAFSSTSGDYLVVMEYVFSAADTDIYAVAVTGGGIVVANSFTTIDGSGDAWSNPRVASSGPNYCVVASVLPQAGGTRAIWGRLRAVASTQLQAKFQISGGEQGDKVHPDVGGEFAGPVNFCVVWQRNYSATDHDIHYRTVGNDGAALGTIQYIANASSTDDFQPRIGKSDGAAPASAQFWPVVWTRFNGQDNDVWGARIRWDGLLATAPFGIDTAAGHNDVYPSVSSLTDTLGNWRCWMVVYATNYLPANGLDLYARVFADATVPAQVSSGSVQAAEGLTGAEAARDQTQPQIDSDGCRFTIAYLESAGANDRNVFVSTIAMLGVNLRGIDVRVPVDTSASDTVGCSLSSARSGGGSAIYYGVVFDLDSASAHRVEATIYTGIAANGGLAVRPTGCSGLTISTANGSQLPAPGQTLRYDIGGALGPSFFLVGWPVAGMTLCAPRSCAIGVNPFGYVLVPGGTLQLTVPCAANLVGSTLSVQGGALGSAAGCTEYANVAVTDTVDATFR